MGWTRRGTLALLGAGVVAAGMGPVEVQARPPLVFEIRTGERAVGRHEVVFQPLARGGVEVRTTIEVKVDFAFLTLYRYRHQVREWWRGGVMQALQVEAESTKEKRALVGSLAGDRLLVRTPEGVRTVPLGAMTDIAFWNPAIVRQHRLLDTWDGELVRVRAEDGRADRVEIGGRQVAATRYRLVSDNRRVALVWYDARNEWIKGRIRIGRLELDYVRRL